MPVAADPSEARPLLAALAVKQGGQAADNRSVRSQVRLRVLIPLLVVAIAGLGFVKFGLGALGLGPDQGEPVAASAAGSGSAPATPDEAAAGAQAGGAGETEPADGAAPAPAESGGMEKLQAELETHKVVVLVVYSPDAAVDTIVTREARLGAEDVDAGFVSVNAAKEKLVGDLALTYDLRVTPVVLVFRRGPELKTKLVGWADRETVAQAAKDARRA